MKNKKFVNLILLISLLILLFIGLVNYLMDPLWTFNHSHKYNSKQKAHDERQLKTNFIKARGLGSYNGLLFGSSRSTFINQNDFKDMKIFNYSSSTMYPEEYNKYIEYSKKIKKSEFEYIFLGLDFYTSNSLKEVQIKDPDFYISNTDNILYPFKILFSLEVLDMTRSNLRRLNDKYRPYYNRFNIHLQNRVPEIIRQRRFELNLNRHSDTFKDKNYKYDTRYKEKLQILKENNNGSKFIVFIPVITSELLIAILDKENKFIEYERWLNDIISIFGEVYTFSTINSISKDLQNFPDDDHAYPEVQKKIAYKLTKTNLNEVPKDFGFLINKSNLSEFIYILKKQIHDYKLRITNE